MKSARPCLAASGPLALSLSLSSPLPSALSLSLSRLSSLCCGAAASVPLLLLLVLFALHLARSNGALVSASLSCARSLDSLLPLLLQVVPAFVSFSCPVPASSSFFALLRSSSSFASRMSQVYILEPPTSGKVLLRTTLGDLDIELWPREAPKAVRNFVQLAMEGYFDGCAFHRIVRGFMAQTGDPSNTGDGTHGHALRGT